MNKLTKLGIVTFSAVTLSAAVPTLVHAEENVVPQPNVAVKPNTAQPTPAPKPAENPQPEVKHTEQPQPTKPVEPAENKPVENKPAETPVPTPKPAENPQPRLNLQSNHSLPSQWNQLKMLDCQRFLIEKTSQNVGLTEQVALL